MCFIVATSQPISSLVGIPHRPRTWISHGLAHIVRLAELNSLEQVEQGPVVVVAVVVVVVELGPV